MIAGVKWKFALLPCCFLAASCVHSALGEPAAPPKYVDEAPLPKGWPTPGPYDAVVEKKLPAYRAAFTTRAGQNGAFWTLFRHIQRHNIPMTAPVEMAMEPADDLLRQASMAFLYQDTDVGTTGPDGETVEVRDVPAAQALTYAWQGPDNRENLRNAKEALDAELQRRGIKAGGFRLLGYNGPSTPRAKKTWELQALLPEPGKAR